MKNRRWDGKKDRHLWPFTFSGRSEYRRFGIMLDSGAQEGGEGDCHIRLSAFGYTLICELPPLVPHYRVRHVAQWDAATVARMGRDWYDEVFPREYGFHFTDGWRDLHVHFGPQTFDSRTTKSKVFFLPWRSWRHVRRSLYGADGRHFWTEMDRKPGNDWAAREAVQNACPKVKFEFEDYDGRRLVATTHIEEREWLFGEGWFKWLSLFRRPKIRRSLSLEFSGETGREKGSWKGGTVGTGIDMLPGELHEAAFRRYYEQDHRSKSGPYRVKYIGPAK
jgi:hypothetical protein